MITLLRAVNHRFFICFARLLAPSIICSTNFLYAQNENLLIQSGSSFIVSKGYLVLNNSNLQCNGSFDASNTSVLVTGINNNSFGGSGSIVIKVLTMNTSNASTLTMNDNMQVSDSLNFKNGIINLNGQVIKLTGPGALYYESETSRITGITGGEVIATASSVNKPKQLNIANLGAVITSKSDLGDVTISRSHEPADNPHNNSLEGIQRTYLILPGNDKHLDATLRFYYFNAELNGNDAHTLSLWRSRDGIKWHHIGEDSRNLTQKYVEKTDIARLSYWTLADDKNPLSAAFLGFKAICLDRGAKISWQTGPGVDADHFEIEKSDDAVSWMQIGAVTATESIEGDEYTFVDNAPQPSANYRVKIVDVLGDFGYSPIFPGGCLDIPLPFVVYPNPANAAVTAQLSVRQATNAIIQLVNMQGQIIFTAGWKLQPGLNQFKLPVSRFAAGTYIVSVLVNNRLLKAELNKQ